MRAFPDHIPDLRADEPGKRLEMPAERFVYDPDSCIERWRSRDQRMSEESFAGSVGVGVAMTPGADSVLSPSEFDLG